MAERLIDSADRGAGVGAGRLGEDVDIDVADLAAHLPFDRLLDDHFARQRHFDGLVATGADQRQRDVRARAPAHLSDRLVQRLTEDQMAVDMGDIVARLDPGAARRRILLRRDYLDRAVLHRDGQPEAAVIPLGHDPHVVEVERIDIGGMRVEAGEHPLDRAVDQFLVVGRVDIIRLYPAEHLHETIEFARGATVGGGGRLGRERDEAERAGERDGREKATHTGGPWREHGACNG